MIIPVNVPLDGKETTVKLTLMSVFHHLAKMEEPAKMELVSKEKLHNNVELIHLPISARYTCECLPGYYGENCEMDVDECNSYPCENGATCVDLNNDYKCQCVDGFAGKNCEIDINDCEVCRT